MTTITLVPNGTILAADSLVGGATAHAVTADNSNASYAVKDGILKVDMDTVVLPSGAITKHMRAKGKIGAHTGTVLSLMSLQVNGTSRQSLQQQVTTAITFVVGPYIPVTLTQAEVDSLAMATVTMSSGTLRTYDLWTDLVYVLKPALVFSAVTPDPLTTISQATLNWNPGLDSDGGSQTHYEYRIFGPISGGGFPTVDSGGAVYASGEVASAAITTKTPVLVNSSYRVYLRVAQTVNGAKHWSDWKFDDFTINVDDIDLTSVTATPDNPNGAISITVVPSAAGGDAWSTRTASASQQWTDVVWSPELNLFVAVSQSGTNRVGTSPDGITWTTRAVTIDGAWKAVTWSPELGLFVAVAASGTVQAMTSPDGITWTGRTISIVGWKDVAWSPGLGLFVAVGDSTSTVASSPDGITWTNRARTAGQPMLSIEWSPELAMFVAVGGTGAVAGQIITSYNGTSWTTRTNPAGASAQMPTDVVWSAELGKFVVVTASSSTWTSVNGTSWTLHTGSMPVAVGGRMDWSPEYGLFVVVGSDDILSSPDGTTWTATVAPGGVNTLTAVAWSSELQIFTAVAFNSTFLTSRGWRYVELERKITGTDVWVPVRGSTVVSPNAPVWTIVDYEAPNGVAVTYRARAMDYPFGALVIGDWMESSSVTWQSDRLWIRVPGRPDLNRVFYHKDTPTQRYHVPRGAHYPLNSGLAVIVTGERHNAAGSFSLWTFNQSDADDLLALFEEPVWNIAAPSEWGWDIEYIGVADVDRNRRNKVHNRQEVWVIPFDPVDRPADPLTGTV